MEASRLTKTAVATAALFLALTLGLCACSGKMARVTQVSRQNLFSLSLGRMEDQLDLVESSAAAPAKLRIYMRDGIFFISNGQGRKMMEMSSYGDLLSLIYDPESNPAPVLLNAQGDPKSFRKAFQHPFREIGEIVVNSKQELFIEDRLPPERGVPDESGQSILDAVVLRFDQAGAYHDYIGREGIGGTPFPNIVGLYCTNSDELVVMSMSAADWQVSWYSPDGNLLYSLSVKRDSLPMPGKKDLIASLERVAPDPDSKLLYMKIDYYSEDFDASTKASTGVKYDSSVLWHIDPRDGRVYDPIAIPSVSKKEEGTFGSQSYVRVYEFLGAASGKNLFFIMPEDENGYSVMIVNGATKGIQKIGINVDESDILASAFHLTPDGILSAILASSYEAKVVWWRIDKIIGEVRR
jgi:hypothetical protein